MIDMSSTQEVPPGVMDLLRIFLAARSRGEDAVLILETRRKTLSTKYRSDENSAGAPAATNTPPLKKRSKNPARVERSRLRLEKFIKKKADDKNQAENSLVSPAVGTPSRRLIIDLEGDRSVGSGLASPIPQVDGVVKAIPPDQVHYTFISDYHKDDIEYTLNELFRTRNAQLVSCVAPRPIQSADQECIVAVKKVADEDIFFGRR